MVSLCMSCWCLSQVKHLQAIWPSPAGTQKSNPKLIQNICSSFSPGMQVAKRSTVTLVNTGGTLPLVLGWCCWCRWRGTKNTKEVGKPIAEEEAGFNFPQSGNNWFVQQRILLFILLCFWLTQGLSKQHWVTNWPTLNVSVVAWRLAHCRLTRTRSYKAL